MAGKEPVWIADMNEFGQVVLLPLVCEYKFQELFPSLLFLWLAQSARSSLLFLLYSVSLRFCVGFGISRSLSTGSGTNGPRGSGPAVSRRRVSRSDPLPCLTPGFASAPEQADIKVLGHYVDRFPLPAPIWAFHLRGLDGRVFEHSRRCRRCGGRVG